MTETFNEEPFERTIDRLAPTIPPEYFTARRWFGSKSRPIEGCRLADLAMLQNEPNPFFILFLEIARSGANPGLYQLPLTFRQKHDLPETVQTQPHGIALKVTTHNGTLYGYDAFTEDRFCESLYRAMWEDGEVASRQGKVIFHHLAGRMDEDDVRTIERVSTEQSNTSIVFNGNLILKVFRKLAPGLNPDFEIPYYLTASAGFEYVPKVAGFIEYRAREDRAISLGVLQEFVPNRGDGYTNALERGREYFAEIAGWRDRNAVSTCAECTERGVQALAAIERSARQLGHTSGLMHDALAQETPLPDFHPEPITHHDIRQWEQSITDLANSVLDGLEENLANASNENQEMLREVATRRTKFLRMARGLAVLSKHGCYKTRYHGDYHLGQVLETDSGFVIVDFEGEPARSLEERRAKHCPLKDVAGMLRSFSYAASAVLLELQEELPAGVDRNKDLERWALLWEESARSAFLEGYLDAIGKHRGPCFAPADPEAFDQVVRIFEIEKALYELNYEFNSRPKWVPIPARGLLRFVMER